MKLLNRSKYEKHISAHATDNSTTTLENQRANKLAQAVSEEIEILDRTKTYSIKLKLTKDEDTNIK